MDLDTLTKKEWKRLKKEAGFEKKKGLGQHDASVGKAIENFVSKRKQGGRQTLADRRTLRVNGQEVVVITKPKRALA